MDHEASPQNLPPPQTLAQSEPESPLLMRMADFQEHLSPSETPFTQSLLGPPAPAYCRKTVQEPRHPEHEAWVEARHLLEMVTPEDVENDPWWEPTAAWRKLDRLVARLHGLAFNTIPNPEYDEHRCEEWHKEHPGRRAIDQKKVVWGTSNLVPYNNEEKITVGSTDSNSTS